MSRRIATVLSALVGALLLLSLLAGCARQAAKQATPTPKAPAAAPTAAPQEAAKAAPATPSPVREAPKATAPAGPEDYTRLAGKLECPMCETGLAQAHPLIATYHWSKLARPKGNPKRGGTLRVQLRYDPSNWDPFTGNTGTYVWGNVIYNKLVVADQRLSTAFETNGRNLMQLVPICDLCESWKQSGPTQYTFKINPNARWQNVPPLNGRKLTAGDIKYSYDKYIDPKAFQQWAVFQLVDNIQAPDDSTLVINLKQPVSDFVEMITHPAYYVFPKEGFEREGGLKLAPPLGSGFMKFVQHIPSNRLTWARNAEYWKKDEQGQQLPYLDGIDIVWMPDVSTQLAAFRTGKTDTEMTFSWDLVEDLLRTEKVGENSYLRVMQYNTGGHRHFYMQLREPPFDDVRVRRALALAVDRKAIINRAFGKGMCPVIMPTWWLGRTYPADCSDTSFWGQWYTYNPERAKALLKEAGYDEKNPLTFDLLANAVGGVMDVQTAGQAEAAVEYWRNIGVKANLKVTEATAFTSQLRGKKWKGMLGVTGQGIGTTLDAFAQKLRSDGPENYSGVNDPEIDKLVDAQRAEFDVEKRKAIARQIAARDIDQVYQLSVAMNYFAEWTKPYVQNWVSQELYYFQHGWGAFAIEYTWFDK